MDILFLVFRNIMHALDTHYTTHMLQNKELLLLKQWNLKIAFKLYILLP